MTLSLFRHFLYSVNRVIRCPLLVTVLSFPVSGHFPYSYIFRIQWTGSFGAPCWWRFWVSQRILSFSWFWTRFEFSDPGHWVPPFEYWKCLETGDTTKSFEKAWGEAWEVYPPDNPPRSSQPWPSIIKYFITYNLICLLFKSPQPYKNFPHTLSTSSISNQWRWYKFCQFMRRNIARIVKLP